jgi:hypothetical protein
MLDKLSSWILSINRGVTYDSEEESVLQLTGRTAKKTNEIIDDLAQKDIAINDRVTKTDLKDYRKLDENGNFTGAWFGIPRPEYAEPGQASIVATHTDKLSIMASVYFKGQGNDDTINFQNVLNQAGENGSVWATGKIHIKSDIIIPNGVKIYGDAIFYNDFPNGTGLNGHSLGSTLNNYGIVALKQLGSKGDNYLSTDTLVSEGSQNINFSSHNLSIGDYVFVNNNSTNSYDRRREIAKVINKNSTSITLECPLHFNYNSPTVTKLNLSDGVQISDTIKFNGVGLVMEYTKGVKIKSAHKASFMNVIRSVGFNISPVNFDSFGTAARIDVFACCGYGNISIANIENIDVNADNSLLKLNQVIETNVSIGSVRGGRNNGFGVMLDTNYAEDIDGFTDVPNHTINVDFGVMGGFGASFLAICDPTRGEHKNINVKGSISNGMIRLVGINEGQIDIVAPNSVLQLEGCKNLDIKGRYESLIMMIKPSSINRPTWTNDNVKFIGTTFIPTGQNAVNFKNANNLSVIGVTVDTTKLGSGIFTAIILQSLNNYHFYNLVYIDKTSDPVTQWAYNAGNLSGESAFIGTPLLSKTNIPVATADKGYMLLPSNLATGATLADVINSYNALLNLMVQYEIGRR